MEPNGDVNDCSFRALFPFLMRISNFSDILHCYL